MTGQLLQFPRVINPIPRGDFGLIAADPPWKYASWSENNDPNNSRAPERHYQTQTLEWIASLPVAQTGGANVHLMLWIPGPFLVAGAHLPILESWNFRPSGIAYVWLKQNKKALQGRFFPPVSEKDFFMGLGKTTRQNAEFVVLGRRGRPVRHDKGNHQLIIEPRREHSRKPEDFYTRAERYAGDVRRLELFGRQQREGWEVWGNETAKFSNLPG